MIYTNPVVAGHTTTFTLLIFTIKVRLQIYYERFWGKLGVYLTWSASQRGEERVGETPLSPAKLADLAVKRINEN